ncbi:FAD-dependent oxidoreductase [Leifsonia shinshuensis]|uniref:Thioredoxin reductase (NADPH) n=1 Tax=Leifsonia shinshuensis TaxID=150026 RepID=A0A853CPZ6_9MICO|nr:FAD-dependent oxidoreductase [Leifsonia shinshuensis]NYJ22737.1 thioredoxin reductase (NADPH) [Leifsonia shinshuensis]
MTDPRSEPPEQVTSAETPDALGAYPRLTPPQLQALSEHGATVPVSEGQVLARAGEPIGSFFAVIEGRVGVQDTDPDGQGARTEVHGPGRFVGDIGLLEGQPSFATVTALQAGTVLAVPIPALERIVTGDPLLGDIILRAYLIRRSLAIGAGAGLRIVGSRFSPDTRRLLDFAARNRIPHRLLDLDGDPAAELIVRRLSLDVADLPVVIVGGTRIMRNPSVAEVSEALGIRRARAQPTCDLLVVGAGPAGLAATVYAASDGLSVVLCDSVATGGQAAQSARIENYLGFPAGISGAELAERARLQAAKFGATVVAPASAEELDATGGAITVRFSDGTTVTPRAVVVASGMEYRRLAAKNLDRFEYTSVYYAATINEARECGIDPVVVVGGGNSAGQAAVFLSGTASHVHLVVRGDELGADMSRYLVAQVEDHPRITVHVRSEVVEAAGGSRLESVTVEHRPSGAREELPTAHLFVFIGAVPATAWLGPGLERDERGYLLTGPRPGAAEPLVQPFETSAHGVFAVGDVRSGSVKRMSAAVGEGASVVKMVHDYLATGGSRS